MSTYSPLTIFKCLADDTRLKTLLLITDRQELCVCDLQTALKVSQPKISRHLAEIRKCGLVETERRGQWVYYRLHTSLPEWISSILKETLMQNKDFLADCFNRMSSPTSPSC